MRSDVQINFKGGIGNQVLQFAAGLYFAEMLDVKLILNPSYYDDNACHSGFEIPSLFNLQDSERIGQTGPTLRSAIARKVYIQEGQFGNSFSHSIFHRLRPTRLVLDGYFLTSYFIIQTVNLLKDLMPPVVPQDVSTCFMHVRRGDFLNAENAKNYRNLEVGYYSEAISRFSNGGVSNVVLLTDDRRYCQETMIPALRHTHPNLRFEVSESSSPVQDFQLLLGASMMICANSTFSATAALLNEGCEVVMPSKWFFEPSFKPYSIHRPESIVL